jgi:phosphate/sulfate permease
MLAALFAAARWVNLATVISAPVSTTHAIVGGVMGAGIAAAGIAVVNRGTMSKIAASWVISPVLGGVVAALFLGFMKIAITNQEDKIGARQTGVRGGPLSGGSNAAGGNGGGFRRRKLVRRGHLMTIAAAWVVTVPATAVMAGVLFFLIDAYQQ